MLHLKEANHADIEEEYPFVRDMPEDENGLTNPWHGISRDAFDDALQRSDFQMKTYSGLFTGENFYG